MGFHQSNEGNKKRTKASEHPNNFILGRFSNSGPILRGDTRPFIKGHRSSPKIGLQNKLGEVFKGTPESLRVSGGHDRLGGYDILSPRRENSEDPVFLRDWPEGLSAYKKGVREARRLLQLRGPVFETRQALFETHCPLDEQKHSSFSEGSFRSTRQLSQGSSVALDEPIFPKAAHSHKTPFLFKDPYDGRVSRGLERSYVPSFSERSLAFRMDSQVYELERTKSSAFVFNKVSAPVTGSWHQGSYRQHDNPGLYKEGGLLSIPSALGPLQGSSSVCTLKEHIVISSSSEGKAKCPGGQGVKKGSDQHGMVSGSQIFQVALPVMGDPSGGPFCHQRELSTTPIRFSMPRSLGSNLGCSGRRFGLESLEINIPLSAFSAFRRSNPQVDGLQRFRLLGDAFLANGSLVRPLREMLFQYPPPERGLFVPEVFRNHLPPQEPLIFQASRMETIRLAISKEGLNDYSVRVLCRCHKDSTINQYQGVWSKFLCYLASIKIQHHKVKIIHVLNSLSFYSELNNLAYKTLAVYKNALRLPLLFSLGLNLDFALVVHYMLGLHAIKPPPSHGFMPP